MIFPGGPNQQDLLNTLQPPSWSHPFGTDNLGRDIFTRTIYAARIDLMVGLITTYVPLVLGVLLGLVAGYRGGWLETVVMRAVDVVVAFPFIVLVIAVIAIVGPGLLGVYIGISRRRLGALRAPHACGGARAQGPAVRARRDEPRLSRGRGSSSGTSSRT